MFKVSDELEHAFTHARTVTVDVLRERLQAKQEDAKNEDRYPISLTKDDLTVGHVPRGHARIL